MGDEGSPQDALLDGVHIATDADLRGLRSRRLRCRHTDNVQPRADAFPQQVDEMPRSRPGAEPQLHPGLDEIQRAGRGAQCVDFSVGGGVVVGHGVVVRHGQHLAVLDHHRTHRHLTGQRGQTGLLQGQGHVLAIEGRRVVGGHCKMAVQSRHCVRPAALLPVSPMNTSTAQRPLRVLVADDNTINLRVATRVLRDMGHSGVLVTDGEKALKAMESQRFDLVLLDVTMPNMDGPTMLEKMRSGGNTTEMMP